MYHYYFYYNSNQVCYQYWYNSIYYNRNRFHDRYHHQIHSNYYDYHYQYRFLQIHDHVAIMIIIAIVSVIINDDDYYNNHLLLSKAYLELRSHYKTLLNQWVDSSI